MSTILSEMIYKYELLSQFKNEMNDIGYTSRDLYLVQTQQGLLKELIDLESENVLKELLKKTYYRLLKSIDKGIEYIPKIIDNPTEWTLDTIDNDKEAWISKDVLILTCRNGTIVFSKITRKTTGAKYIDNKWQ